MGFGFFSIIPIIIFTAIIIGGIVIVVRLSGKRNTDQTMTKKEGETLLKNIYVYLVLFATIMMSIGGSIGVFMGIADYLAPSVYMESYDSFYETRVRYHNYNEPPNEDVIRAAYEMEKQERTERYRTDAIRQIIKSLGWIIIPLPVFLYYNKRQVVAVSVGRAHPLGCAQRVDRE